MRAAADLQPPVGYDDRWVLLAAAAVVAVTAYYALAWWLTRPREPRRTTPRGARDRCLAALARIESAVAAGETTPREAHQQVSRTVREFVATESGVPVETVTLAALRREGPERLAELVAVLYPPEFGPGEDRAVRELDDTLGRARGLVTTWT